MDVEEEEKTGIVEPCVGMEFESEDAARNFYSEYARRLGFVVRVMQRRRSGIDGRTLARRLGCNKQGFSPNIRTAAGPGPDKKPRPSAREGCKATILVKMDKSGKWVVTRFEKDHNHPLVVTASGFSSSWLPDLQFPIVLNAYRNLKTTCVCKKTPFLSESSIVKSFDWYMVALGIPSSQYDRMFYLRSLLQKAMLLYHILLFALPLTGDKDKKIEELMKELEHQEHLCATYREKLVSFMNNVEEQTEEMASKIQLIVNNVRKVESEVQNFPRRR
ncbi:hypothetical protein DKX38_003512 [Salix brachista]|uniref:FAR1 domain-containing protein n=1 Tax=Salix brachista TaxID=2182728 RepID=A0A5N5NR69_9ROSI|nr:hypothetical protein DKX38_003512 [Salix brachista]